MKPKAFNTLFCVFNDIVAYLLENFIIWNVKSTKIYLQHFYVLACGEHSPNITEKVIKDLLFCKMTIAETLQFDICDLCISSLISYIFFELFELAFSAKKI